MAMQGIANVQLSHVSDMQVAIGLSGSKNFITILQHQQQRLMFELAV
jgi:hypothetical protein